ncbi:hypothetical protein PNEG_02451 [Pneumocystis murina B123]|uniref:Asparagine-rich protein n=1 Tax=Pneumocystis murina (strain B123) TaxID=1069680 RepID=M7NPB9_PNEMU|nr:hypothetical protein PNEG_02451 [Pneumocystis murina B123]EMR09107.1 hypothetical protein PNEG_02451 [Pneumocystis murina B123]
MPLLESLDSIIIVHGSTCYECGIGGSKEAPELIELSWILVDAKTLEEQHKEDFLVRPVNTPITNLSNFIALTWENIQAAGTFREVIHHFATFIQEKLILNNKNFIFAAFDAKKLTIQLPKEARDKSVILPSYLQHPRVYDLHTEYSRWQSYHPETLVYRSSNITHIRRILETDIHALSQFAQQNFQVSFENTSPRRAIDECLDLLYIFKSLVEKSKLVDKYPDIFSRPLDIRADVKAFLAERSCILYMAGLPYDITQSELENWFTQHGSHPIAFWTLKTPDQYKPTGIGFAIFSSHEEAIKSLVMNGRAIEDRIIEISPSSSRVLERAAEILIPFPLSKNKPRPGDWNCPFCGFSNFQRRTACFRCSFSAFPANINDDPMMACSYVSFGGNFPLQPSVSNADPSFPSYPLAIRTSTQGGNVPFRAGDWKCKAEGCGYHNFAKNTNCLKCGANKNTFTITDHNISSSSISSQIQPVVNPTSYLSNSKNPAYSHPMQQIPLNTTHNSFYRSSILTSFSPLKQPAVPINNETIAQSNGSIVNKEKVITNKNNEKETNTWHCTSCFFINLKFRNTCLLCGTAISNTPTSASSITNSTIIQENSDTLECFNENMTSELLHEDLKALIIDDNKSLIDIKKDTSSKMTLLPLDS